MRLGQLARKLSLRQSAIVDFLAQQNIQIDDGSNARLEDDHVLLIMQHFAPEQEASVRTELADEKITDNPEGNAAVEEATVQRDEIQSPPSSVVEVAAEEKAEVIRVQKIELSGLKVLGKIDLPEPKKKEPAPTDERGEQTTASTEKQLPRKGRKEFKNRSDRRERKHHNPIAWQREREAKEAAEQRRVEAEREKERKKRHYHTKVKSLKPAKAKPAKEGRKEDVIQPIKPKPTTLLGKFWRWLRP